MKHRVLVVEDDRSSRELLCDWLEVQGYKVQAATDMKGALASLEVEPPHAVLLDVQLGPEDGLSLALWIRQNFRLRNIPVIAVTAHAMITERQRILQSGCAACVSKPIDFSLLRELLQSQLVGSVQTSRTR